MVPCESALLKINALKLDTSARLVVAMAELALNLHADEALALTKILIP
jgi:hypothetical protein